MEDSELQKKIILRFLSINSLILAIPIACIFLVGKYADDGNAAVFILLFYSPIIIIPVIWFFYNLFKLLKRLKLENPDNYFITIVRDAVELALYSFGIWVILFFYDPFTEEGTKIGELFELLFYNFHIFTLAIISFGVIWRYLQARKKNPKQANPHL